MNHALDSCSFLFLLGFLQTLFHWQNTTNKRGLVNRFEAKIKFKSHCTLFTCLVHCLHIYVLFFPFTWFVLFHHVRARKRTHNIWIRITQIQQNIHTYRITFVKFTEFNSTFSSSSFEFLFFCRSSVLISHSFILIAANMHISCVSTHFIIFFRFLHYLLAHCIMSTLFHLLIIKYFILSLSRGTRWKLHIQNIHLSMQCRWLYKITPFHFLFHSWNCIRWKMQSNKVSWKLITTFDVKKMFTLMSTSVN